MSTSGRRLLSAIVKEGSVNTYLKMGLEPDLFKEGEALLFQAIQKHLTKFGTIPKQGTIEALPGMADSIVDAPEPAKFYLAEVEKRYLHNTLKAGVQEITSLLSQTNPEEALEVFTRVTTEMYKKKQRKHVTDFRDALEIVKAQYVAQKGAAGVVALPFGWPTLDDMSGGARKGDFISIVGRPMMGKTFMMLRTGHYGWRSAPRTPLLVSMEMHADLIHTRLAAMDTQTKLTHLMKAQLSTHAFNKMMDKLHDLKGMQRPFWVVDGNVVKTVEDIIMQCHILQPDAVWIDAAYLLKHKNSRLGKWDRQSENAEMIKEQIATDLEMPVIASYQLSKESSKSKKKNKEEKSSMDDIYGRDDIAQLSSLILGLFQFEDDVEALNKRRVQILKGRSGETGEFTINWDFSAKMDFTEYKPEKPAEMQMSHLG
jgi:replicative DNA helicase